MKPNPPLYCASCKIRIPNRADRLIRYCKKCFLELRCKNCGQILPKNKSHKCRSVDLIKNRLCLKCGKNLRYDGWERYSKICSQCGKKKFRQHERERRKELRLLFGGKCQICGYNKCADALHFHHKNSKEKYIWNVKGKGGASIREVKKYPERFLLLCANCHIGLHSKERKIE